jgi:hypothetical protein
MASAADCRHQRWLAPARAVAGVDIDRVDPGVRGAHSTSFQGVGGEDREPTM